VKVLRSGLLLLFGVNHDGVGTVFSPRGGCPSAYDVATAGIFCFSMDCSGSPRSLSFEVFCLLWRSRVGEVRCILRLDGPSLRRQRCSDLCVDFIGWSFRAVSGK